MEAITIPQNLIQNDDLVIIPLREYKAFLGWKQKFSKAVKNSITKKSSAATQLDKDLDESIEEIRQGKAIGPFYNVADLMKSLKS